MLPFRIAGPALLLYLAEGSIMRGMCASQIAPQVQINSDGHAHYNERADTQDQEPPDHPHSRLG
jgi:hypothetical protein